MTHKRRFKIDQLIRDKLPAIMRSKGIDVFECILEQDEYINSLKDKLIKEAHEVLVAQNRSEISEELADILEVIMTLCHTYNLAFEEVEQIRVKKKVEKGGFESKIYNAFVEIDPHNQSIDYYLARPHQYPAVK